MSIILYRIMGTGSDDSFVAHFLHLGGGYQDLVTQCMWWVGVLGVADQLEDLT